MQLKFQRQIWGRRPCIGGKVLASMNNSNRQREISIWPPKPEIITSLELWQIASKFQRQIPDFRWCLAGKKISQMIAINDRLPKMQDWRPKRLYCCFRLLVSVTITWQHFIRARHDWKSRTCRWNFDPICCSCSDRTTSGFGGHIAISRSLFPVVVRCYSHLLTLFASWPWLKTPGLPSEL